MLKIVLYLFFYLTFLYCWRFKNIAFLIVPWLFLIAEVLWPLQKIWKFLKNTKTRITHNPTIQIPIVSISVYSRLDFSLHIFTYIDKYSAKPCPTLVIPWTVACQTPLSMEFSRWEYWSGLPFYIDKYIFVKTKGVFCFIVTFSLKSISEHLSRLMHASLHYIFDEHNYPLTSRLYLYFIYINKPVGNNLAHRSLTTHLVIPLEYIPSSDVDEYCRDLRKPLIFSHLSLPPGLCNNPLYISEVL